MESSCSRRQFVLKSASLIAGAACGLLSPLALANDFWSQSRSIWMVNAQTNEQVHATYFADGALIEEGYLTLCRMMRDTHAGVAAYIDPVLLDIFCGMQGWFKQSGKNRVLVLNSGYRTDKTNAGLRPEGAARSSLHREGRAGDVWIPDVPTDYLARLGIYLRGGGVGYYPAKRFVHVDTGRLRVWTGTSTKAWAQARSQAGILIR